MKKILITLLITGSIFTLLNTGCTKGFLEAKPSTDIVQPTRLDEFQKLLDNTDVIKGVGLAILASDEYRFSTDATWLSVSSVTARNSYIWAKDLYESSISNYWNDAYSNIFYANNVLAGLEKIEINALNTNEWHRTKGWALFVRAFAYYELVNNFSPFYDELTASTDLGVPLRLNPSIDELMPRSTVKKTFDRIFADLNQATALLDLSISPVRSRPSKAASHALFARIYLNMRDYAKAELHADTCLSLYNKLIDYNTINKTAPTPFVYNHDEQIYVRIATADAGSNANGANPNIDMSPDLINLYEPNDLRLVIYYNKQANSTYDIKRGYSGAGSNLFIGLATDEVYLIKAECLARRGDYSSSMDKLNQLLIKRWDPAATSPAKPFQNLTATSASYALAKILIERRKELIWRGTRWDDLKRFNKEGANITLSRSINGQTYTLPPNSPKYVFPIPDNEINLSGIQQNVR